MKKIFSSLLLLVAGMTASAQTMQVNDVIVVPGKSSVVAVKFAETSTLLASGFSMQLPTGITVDEATPMSANFPTGTAVVTDLSQLTDDTFKGNYAILVGAAQSDGTYKVACISNILKTEETPVVYVPIKASADLKKGTPEEPAIIEGSVNKIDLSTDGNVAATLADFAYNTRVTGLGDVDGNFTVNVSDALAVFEDITTGKYSENNPKLADVDENGAINVSDALKVFNIIVAGE